MTRRERIVLEQMVRFSGVSGGGQAFGRLLEKISRPPPRATLRRAVRAALGDGLASPALARLVLAMTWEVALADGEPSARERALSRDLARSLGVPRGSADRIRRAFRPAQ